VLCDRVRCGGLVSGGLGCCHPSIFLRVRGKLGKFAKVCVCRLRLRRCEGVLSVPCCGTQSASP
jgi:hypothetical protein